MNMATSNDFTGLVKIIRGTDLSGGWINTGDTFKFKCGKIVGIKSKKGVRFEEPDYMIKNFEYKSFDYFVNLCNIEAQYYPETEYGQLFFMKEVGYE